MKSQWPKSNHGFFMHPPLLKFVAGRRQNQRFRSCTEGKSGNTRRKGQHQCRICKGYGHHWHTCKYGDPEHCFHDGPEVIYLYVYVSTFSFVLTFSIHVFAGDHQKGGKRLLKHQQRIVLFLLMMMHQHHVRVSPQGTTCLAYFSYCCPSACLSLY